MNAREHPIDPLSHFSDGRPVRMSDLLPQPEDYDRRLELARTLMRLHADPLPANAMTRCKLNALIALHSAGEARELGDTRRWNEEYAYACEQVRMCLRRVAVRRLEADTAALRG